MSQWSGTQIRTWHRNNEPTARWRWRWFTRMVSLKTNRSVLMSPWISRLPSLNSTRWSTWTTEHVTVCTGSYWQTELSSSSFFQQLRCSGSVSAVQQKLTVNDLLATLCTRNTDRVGQNKIKDTIKARSSITPQIKQSTDYNTDAMYIKLAGAVSCTLRGIQTSLSSLLQL